jgi:stage V sporulation protein S
MAFDGAMTEAVGGNGQKPIIWIRPNSNVQNVAGLITSSIGEDERVTLRAIGAGAVNQALKGVILARQKMAAQGVDLIVRPGFTLVEGRDGSDVTAVLLNCSCLP